MDHIERLSPAISIEQKSTPHNPCSTVGSRLAPFSNACTFKERRSVPRPHRRLLTTRFRHEAQYVAGFFVELVSFGFQRDRLFYRVEKVIVAGARAQQRS